MTGAIRRDGRLHVLGRLGQVVIRGGYTISPAEVEGELGAHPEIAEVACVGVPDDDLGERLCACVVPRGPGLTLDRLTRFLEARGLERRKLPESWSCSRNSHSAPPARSAEKPCSPSLSA